MGGDGTSALAAQRRHTLYFLEYIRPFGAVFLDTEVDMTAVLRHRAAAKADDRRYSLVSYVLLAGGAVLAKHPDANAAISGRGRPRVTRYATVTGKLAIDSTLAGERIVLSALVPGLDTAGLDEVQDRIDAIKAVDPAEHDEFRGVRLLHRLPPLLGRLAYRVVTRSAVRREELLGSFSVTSLGHRPVDGFYSVGGTTITLGVGRIVDRPVARDGAVTVAPSMRLSLAFDHRVIDGAEAADVLADIKDALEGFA
ncbi:2-oxo acid dehydrogenase subunit E2 [Micromonospora lupini]|uniref:2-oxo acid dehydrogenase subunit E2 n=1 Tax=Micromonospora lupini TaxID=285679 RepID=UPI0022523A39|nr:2-oxo acid dehydrogenase subunit E2 [Micromonospora lupini]MCX5065761.1 2-oxo acid dehydrogenase subunit E2 [Micromonospora lupini]